MPLPLPLPLLLLLLGSVTDAFPMSWSSSSQEGCPKLPLIPPLLLLLLLLLPKAEAPKGRAGLALSPGSCFCRASGLKLTLRRLPVT